MARVTIEDCLSRVDNHFDLVLVGSRRARQILAGAELTTDDRRDRATVTALREIAAGSIDQSILDEPVEESKEDAEKELAALLKGVDEEKSAEADESLAAALEAAMREDRKTPEEEDAGEGVSLEGLQAQETDAETASDADTQTAIQDMTAEDMAQLSDLNLDTLDATSEAEPPDEDPRS